MARKKKPQNSTTDVVPADEQGNDVSKSQGELTAAKIKRLFSDGREDIAGELVQYWINVAFWLGCQWLYYDDTKNEIIPVSTSVKKRREQATMNRIEPAVHNTVSRVQKTELSFEVQSDSADDYTQQGARKGEALIRQKHKDDDWETIKEELATATILGGTAGLLTRWDKDANKLSPDLPTGDGFLEALTIEDFVVETGSIDGKHARWAIHKQVLPPEQVQAMFNLDYTPQRDGSDSGPFSEKVSKTETKIRAKSGTQVLWYYERPNALREEGAVAAVVGQKIVWQDKWPYPFKDRLPIDVTRCIVVPKRWTGETYITQAISPQRQYNHVWTKVHESRQRSLGAKLLIDDRHAQINGQLNDDPEIPIKLAAVPDARDPKYLEYPNLPPQTIQEIQALQEELDDILFVHDISRGETPANSPDSGYGLSLLSEQDATPAGRLTGEVARSFASGASNLLELYAANVKDTRTVHVTAGRGLARPVKWRGSDLAGQTRVIVPPDSVLPRSHAGMLKFATDLLQYKPDWFPTPTSWLAVASVPGFEDIQQQMDDDVANADYENFVMAQGEALVPEDWDDDAKHIQWHHHFCKSPEFRRLDKKTQGIFRAHIAAHQANAAHKAGVATAMQQLHPALGTTPMGQLNAGPPQALNEPSLPDSGANPFVPQVNGE